MGTELVHYAVSEAIAQITLDRAPVNALSMPLIDALLEALEKARADESVRAVVVCSAHKVFCAGLDLDIVRGKRGTETKAFLERLYFALNDVQYRMGKPTIAAVDGPARAGGMTIAISCDMIIAGEAATFGYPEIDVGLIPALHFVHLPRLVGKHQAFGPLFLVTHSMPRRRFAWASSAKWCPREPRLTVRGPLRAASPRNHRSS